MSTYFVFYTIVTTTIWVTKLIAYRDSFRYPREGGRRLQKIIDSRKVSNYLFFFYLFIVFIEGVGVIGKIARFISLRGSPCPWYGQKIRIYVKL